MLLLLTYINGEARNNQKEVGLFPIKNIRLSQSDFKNAESLDISYIMGLNPDRLLAPYMKEAGLTPKAENYSNWENTGLDGHIGGHYLSALSYMYATTDNSEIGRRLDYFLNELSRCQEASGNGYLSGVPNGKQIWNDIKNGNINASPFGLNDRWVPLYNIHKIFSGLRDAYTIAGKEKAKSMLISLTDWMYDIASGLSDEQIQDMLRSEHGGLNEVFADVYYITGDRKYLDMAKRLSHRVLLDPLLRKEDKLTGMHANTQIPKVIGFKRIADLEGNKEWSDASDFFWHTVVNNRSVSIGGNSVREHFHSSNDFSSMMESEQGPETCNTYNMLRLTEMLYRTTGDVEYVNYYERALYNHILSSINPVQGGFVYFTPMRSGHYRVYSQPQTSFWCCVGSGLENHAKYGEMIYAHKPGELIVNLFIPSTLKWDENSMTITQETQFPYSEMTKLIIRTKKAKSMKISLRYPGWVSSNEPVIKINGKDADYTLENGYVTVNRKWDDGDSIEMELPMKLHTMQLPDKSPYYSFMYGPIVLAADMGKERLDGMFADDSRGGHIASGPQLPLQNIPAITGDEKSLLQNIKKVSADKLEFCLNNVYPSNYEGMTLRPFAKLHDCRYMVYWKLETEDGIKEKELEIARKENERLKLDMSTIDMVSCGEQQPESDHFIRMSGSIMGNDNGIFWRDTNDWFSYKMRTKGKSPRSVMIKVVPDNSLNAKIYINGIEAGTIKGESDIHEFSIPEEVVELEELEIRITRHLSERSLKVSSIRLLE